MIDKITMNSIIPIHPSVYQSGWRRFKQLYFLDYHGLKLLYAPLTQRLTIKGRLIMLSAQRDRVTNLDTPWRGIADVEVIQHHSIIDGERHIRYDLKPIIQDMESLVLEINVDLSHLLQTAIDIREFQVTYSEFCFNVYTEHVGTYISLFNQIFARRDPAKYKDYVIENDRSSDSSFYIKSKKQFETKKRLGTTVNFYNKMDWLENKLQEDEDRTNRKLAGRTPKTLKDMTPAQKLAKEVVPLDSVYADFDRIQNCLRLEVQLGSQALYRLVERDRPFSRFLDINFCRDIVIKQYEKFIGNETADFYSYPRAEEIIESSPFLTNTRRKNLLGFLHKLNGGHNPYLNHDHHFISTMSDLGIHCYLLQERDFLISPMKLLREVVESSKALAETRELREEAAMEEALMYNSIQVTDD